MRRFLELSVLVATAGILVATSQAPHAPCGVETANVRSETSCGPVANVVLSTFSNCAVTASGADFGGLPILGSLNLDGVDAGLRQGFKLSGATDAGPQTCTVSASDAGFDIRCEVPCVDPDGGNCVPACGGSLTLQ